MLFAKYRHETTSERTIQAMLRDANVAVLCRRRPVTAAPLFRRVFLPDTFDRAHLVRFDGMKVKSELLELLPKLNHIEEISLSQCHVDREMIALVAKNRNLRRLDLSQTDVKAEDLELLSACSQLTELNVARTPVTREAVKQLDEYFGSTRKFTRQFHVNRLRQGTRIDFDRDDSPIRISTSVIGLREWNEVVSLPGLTRLEITNSHLMDRRAMCSIRELIVDSEQPVDQWLVRFCPELEILTLVSCKIGPEVVDAILVLENLKTLEIIACRFEKPDDVRRLVGHRALTRLERIDHRPDVLTSAREDSQLESVSLFRDLSPESIDALYRLPRLRSLSLVSSQLPPTELARLADLKLEKLRLENTRMNDETLMRFSKMHSLRQIDVSSTNCTIDGANAFYEAAGSDVQVRCELPTPGFASGP